MRQVFLSLLIVFFWSGGSAFDFGPEHRLDIYETQGYSQAEITKLENLIKTIDLDQLRLQWPHMKLIFCVAGKIGGYIKASLSLACSDDFLITIGGFGDSIGAALEAGIFGYLGDRCIEGLYLGLDAGAAFYEIGLHGGGFVQTTCSSEEQELYGQATKGYLFRAGWSGGFMLDLSGCFAEVRQDPEGRF